MRKNKNLEIIYRNRRKRKQQLIFNAKRGAASPWTLGQVQSYIKPDLTPAIKVELFNQRIGNIFPLILDMIVQGQGIASIERQMNLNNRMLWRWLHTRGELMDMVRAARKLRGSVGVGMDGEGAPLAEA